MVEVTMPKLSDSMEEGTVIDWLLDDGADVTVGDELVEIETDKANMVYEAEAAGTLRIVAAKGTTLPIGATMAFIGPAQSALEPAAIASPSTDTAPTAAGTSQTQPLTSVQATIARRMTEAKATMPDFTVTMDVDMTAVVEARAELADEALTPSVNDFVVKACAEALRRHPKVNGVYRDDGFEFHDHVNIGIAVAADDALMVPVIADADRQPLVGITRESRRLADAARTGRLQPIDVAGGTFTISNLGMYGVSAFTAVLNPPQAAILAVGALEQRPVAADGGLAVRPRMTVTLTCDHRIVYGADAAAFLRDVRTTLEHPNGLLDPDPEG
jgi:pyruvate dehydrogenase E2 component (dihydrolipoamide acetyltransferase)